LKEILKKKYLNVRGLSIPALQGREEVSTTIIIIIIIIPYGIIYEKRKSFKYTILIPLEWFVRGGN
jgi:hypothetical protein